MIFSGRDFHWIIENQFEGDPPRVEALNFPREVYDICFFERLCCFRQDSAFWSWVLLVLNQSELQDGLIERFVVSWDLDISIKSQTKLALCRDLLYLSFEVLTHPCPILDDPPR